MTLMGRVAIMYVFFAHGHVCDACVPSFFGCARSLRMILSGPGRLVVTEMWEHRKVSGLITRSSSHVNPHAIHMDA